MKLRKVLDIPEGYYRKLAMVESSNNPKAKAKTSSASGLYQFTESTWKGLVKQLGLNYTLEDRFDKDKSQKVVEAFTKQNEKYLKSKLGRDPNEAELYLAHFSGMGGANKLLQKLKENPEADSSEVFSEKALKANKHLQGKKVYEIYNWAAKKFGVDEYELPKKEKKFNLPITERPTVAIDNTAVRLPNTSKNELKTNKNLTEKDVRNILDEYVSKERKQKEKSFLEQYQQILSKQNTQEQQEIEPQQPEQDLSYLYNYIDQNDNYAEQQDDSFYLNK